MRVVLSVIFCLPFIISVAQSTGDFRSFQSGPWNNVNTWERFNGSTWVNPAPSTPTNADGVITISASHIVSIPNGFTAVADQVVIAGTGRLNILNGGLLVLMDGTGQDLTVTIGDGFTTQNGFLTVNAGGVLESRGQITSSFTNTNIAGVFQHNLNGGVILTANWNSGSTLEVIGVTDTKPNGFGQTFYNVVWNSPQVTFIDLNAELLTITNNFTISSTGGSSILILSLMSTSTLNIGGNLTIENSSSFGITPNLPFTINITGNLVVNSNSATNSFLFTSNGNPVTVNVQGNVTKSNTGSVNFSSGTGTGTLNIEGNFTATQGSFTKEPTGFGNINFTGNGIQNYSGGATYLNAIDFTVGSNSILDLGTSVLGGGGIGTFTCNGIVRVGSLNASGAIADNINVATRTFNSESTVVYNGAGAQFMGTAQPSDSDVTTIINNGNDVSLATNTTIGGDLILQSGDLSVGSNTLTLGGTITPNSNSIAVTSSSNISILGGDAFGTLPLSGSGTLNNFTMNRTPGGSVTLGSDLTIEGTFTQTAGTLILNGNDLTISGDYVASNGDITSNATSSLIIEDNGALPTSLNISGGVMQTFTLNRPSAVLAIPATFTVTNLNLLQGTYDNAGGGTTMAAGGTITRGVGSMTQAPGVVSNYNVVYTGTTNFDTGEELSPGFDDRILNFTNSNSGIITLIDNVTINGNLTLSSGSLNATGRTINLHGNFTNNASGTLTSSTFNFVGNTQLLGANFPAFANFNVGSGAALTSLAGIIRIRGSMVLNQASTFAHNNGTIEFNGGAGQSLNGGGKNFYNITVNKTGGTLNLTGQVNLRRLLAVQSATTITTNGNLRLISTSDGASGNASIGSLASGAMISGNVTVQRAMSDEGRIYRYLSSPVQNLPVSQIQDDFPVTGTFTGASTCPGCLTNPSMYSWDESVPGDFSAGYSAFPVSSNTETFETGIGYTAFVRNNLTPGTIVVDFTGTIHQGEISLPVTYTGSGNPSVDGYNLVGNPYPSSIDWTLVTNQTNISPVIAVRDNGTGGTSGTVLYFDNDEELSWPTGHIATGQGFWVRATGSGPSIILDESVKTNSTGAFYREKRGESHMLKIILAKDDLIDRAFVRLKPESKIELDDWDAPKLDNESFDISTVTPGGISMAVNSVKEMICDAINIKIQDMPAGSYLLSTETLGTFTNYSPILIDNFTNTQHDFSTAAEYQFAVTSDPLSSAVNRFSIILDQPEIDANVVTSSIFGETCNVDQYNIALDNTQSGVLYFAELNGEVLSDSVMSNGIDPVVLSIASSSFDVGSNPIVLNGYNLCESVPMAQSLALNHDILYAATASNVVQCLEGSVELVAEGAPENGSYNWYETETSTTPIAGQHSGLFATPVLAKTSTYFVAVVNSNGCEGVRVPVVAEVKNFDPVSITATSTGELSSSYSSGNQWYLDGVIINGATSQTFNPQETGTYSVEVLVDGCTTSDSFDFLVTGLESSNPMRGLSIYPNPIVDNDLHVKASHDLKVSGVSIFNNLGSKIGDVKLDERESGVEGYFDMSNTSSGVYFVKAFMNKRIVTIKVIKK